MFEVAMRSYLLTVAPYVAVVGQRIHPGALPDPPVLPATAFQRVSTVRESAFDGRLGWCWGRFQFDTWATTQSQARSGAQALTDALMSFSGTMGTYKVAIPRQSNDMDMYETETGYYRVMSEFVIWHTDDEQVPSEPPDDADDSDDTDDIDDAGGDDASDDDNDEQE